jgi:hypothetical protein
MLIGQLVQILSNKLIAVKYLSKQVIHTKKHAFNPINFSKSEETETIFLRCV